VVRCRQPADAGQLQRPRVGWSQLVDGGTVVRELHTRTSSQIVPRLRSNDAGEFEAQTYHVGGEAMLPDGMGAEVVRYL
jgi:hypothetical protein